MASTATNNKTKTSNAKKQIKADALINQANAYLDLLPYFTNDTLNVIEQGYLFITNSPFELLFKLLQQFGFTEEQLKEVITSVLTTMLPALETTVKASILANIKTIINCNLDPRIPERYRYQPNDGYFTPRSTRKLINNSLDVRGMFVNVDAIDPDYMLTMSPYTDDGKEFYFGQFINDNPISPYQLVRASDMNAFLWFCIHKGQFPSPTLINLSGQTSVEIGKRKYNVIEGKTLHNYVRLSPSNQIDQGGKPLSINVGNAFSSPNNKKLLSVAITADNDKVEIVPTSTDWNSCNWYVDRSKYFSSNLSSKANQDRDYDKEFALFNIQYLKPSDYGDRYGKTDGLHNIKLSILPKPYTLLPTLVTSITGEQNISWSIAKILFDGNGNVDKKGKYTLDPAELNTSAALGINGYLIIPFLNDNEYVFTFKDTQTYGFAKANNPTVLVSDVAAYEKHLIECYPGLTVYEFNYDFVMGMRIFDPVVVTRRMLDSMFNPTNYTTSRIALRGNRGGDAKANNTTYANVKARVEQFINKLVEEDTELSDCYYKFTNDDYNNLLKKAAEARYFEQPYRTWFSATNPVDMTEINEILNGYPTKGTLEEQKDVITKAINKSITIANEISAEVLQASDGTTTYSNSTRSAVSTQFCYDLLNVLKEVLIESIMTPKLLLLFEVNNQMFADEEKGSINLDGLEQLISNIITSVIKEVLDTLEQKLLDYIISYVNSMVDKLANKIGKEQIMAYVNIVKSLIALFRKGIKTFEECQMLISSRFGHSGYLYNQSATEIANAENSRLGYSYYNVDETGDIDNYDEPIINNC